jgi:hypothetical protein
MLEIAGDILSTIVALIVVLAFMGVILVGLSAICQQPWKFYAAGVSR